MRLEFMVIMFLHVSDLPRYSKDDIVLVAHYNIYFAFFIFALALSTQNSLSTAPSTMLHRMTTVDNKGLLNM